MFRRTPRLVSSSTTSRASRTGQASRSRPGHHTRVHGRPIVRSAGRPAAVGSNEALVNVDPDGRHARSGGRVLLGVEVLSEPHCSGSPDPRYRRWIDTYAAKTSRPRWPKSSLAVTRSARARGPPMRLGPDAVRDDLPLRMDVPGRGVAIRKVAHHLTGCCVWRAVVGLTEMVLPGAGL